MLSAAGNLTPPVANGEKPGILAYDFWNVSLADISFSGSDEQPLSTTVAAKPNIIFFMFRIL